MRSYFLFSQHEPSMSTVGGAAVSAYAPFRFPSDLKFGFSFKLCPASVGRNLKSTLHRFKLCLALPKPKPFFGPCCLSSIRVSVRASPLSSCHTLNIGLSLSQSDFSERMVRLADSRASQTSVRARAPIPGCAHWHPESR